MARSFKQVLEEAGVSMDFHACGTPPPEITNREIQRDPAPSSQALRDIFYETLSCADTEFPYWYSREYFANDLDIPVVRRAKALRSAFSHLTPVIYPGEKLTMHKARYFRGSFPMPWMSEGFYMAHESALYQAALARGSASADEHSMFGQGGGNVTKNFNNVVSLAGKFGMRSEEIPGLLKLARMWVGKSVDDVGNRYERMVPLYPIKEAVMRAIVCMFDSGYTLPQGREIINYYYPLQYGFDGIIKMAEELKGEVAGKADGDPIQGMNRLYNYEAVIQVIKGVQAWILNYAKEAKRLADVEKDAQRKKEYLEHNEILSWIAHNQPRTFREALQLINICHIAVVNEDAISGMSPGRIGQILYPWFEQDIAAGRITEEEVIELLEHDRIFKTSIDCFASAGVVGGVLSGNTFNTVTVGGLNRFGMPAVNRLEYLLLEAGIRNQMPQPTIVCMYDEKLPEDFLMKCMECIKTGSGFPAFCNNSVGVNWLMDHYGIEGITLEDARAITIGGCLETGPGCWKPLELNGKTYWIPGGAAQPSSIGIHFIAMPKVLELTLWDGVDQRTGERVYPPHGRTFETYEDLWDQFCKYWQLTCRCLEYTNNIQHDVWRKNNMCVFNSMLKPDCLDKGHLINENGYRYNATYNVESCGTVTCVNSFIAIKKLVYDDKTVTLEDLKAALKDNFGFRTAQEINNFSIAAQIKRDDDDGKWDKLHFQCLQAPKYGNDDPYADIELARWEEFFCADAKNYYSTFAKPMFACQISVSTHGAQGAATCATADGRLAGTTFSDGSMSAYPGTDRNGPYAVMTSATVWDHAQSQNSQMNMKIHPSAIKGVEGSRKLLQLIRSYMRKGGYHVQFNVVDTRMLRDAQANPQNYRDLMVRVAGFTQYWVEIGKAVQDEVIARTEYEGV